MWILWRHGDLGADLAEVKEKVRGSSSQKSASSLCWKVPGGGSISASRARISSFTRDRDLLGVVIIIIITDLPAELWLLLLAGLESPGGAQLLHQVMMEQNVRI